MSPPSRPQPSRRRSRPAPAWQRSIVVAAAKTEAEAEFVRITLVAHGIAALTSVPDLAHPSLNFVQGINVSVPSDAEEQARQLLAGRG